MSRVFDVDGKLMEFSSSALRRVFETRKRADKTTFAAQEHSLAEALGVSDDTVHNWHYNKNGPIDIDAVKAVASALEMEDYMLLLTETDGSKKMTQLTDRQKTAAKKIYDKCIWFLNEFNSTDGFNEYWLELKDAGSFDPENDSYEKVYRMVNEVFLVYDQEYFDLHDHPIYDDFGEFLSEDLYETFSGKLSCAYRFEASPENGRPTVSQDYDKAMIKLNSIIDKYL